jgi:hypothetical protein
LFRWLSRLSPGAGVNFAYDRKVHDAGDAVGAKDHWHRVAQVPDTSLVDTAVENRDYDQTDCNNYCGWHNVPLIHRPSTV